jgi:ubiquinone/menaquinone biosynthesis C-methylase UbiE
MFTYDDELREHNARLRDATGIRRGDRVLDVGCGAGQTTREAARAAAPGDVLGIDLSQPALERARELTAAQRLDNVTYEHGDAQVHRFAPERFDVAISRFGVMFFADPVAAFANVAHALAPGARLAAMVWQPREENPWAAAIDDALGRAAPPAGEEHFSLGDPATTRAILERAGFHDVRFDAVDADVFYGEDPDEALEWVTGFRYVRGVLEDADPTTRDAKLERLRATLAAHHTDRGVVFRSGAWIVNARRR